MRQPPDTQVTHWKLYRTTDGGSNDPTLMKLVATVAIGTTTYADTTADASLGTAVAPALLRNDPPPASTCFAFSQGRIAMRQAAKANRVWLTGLDEIAQGVATDCVPSGADGNYFDVDREVTAIVAVEDGFAVFTASRIYFLPSGTQDSLRPPRGIIAKRGAKFQPCVAALGNTVVWLDTSSQFWSSEEGEIGEAIRPTLKGIDHSRAQVAIHISGEYHWIVLLDGGRNKLYIYDIDTKQWMPPWNVTATAICSGETSTGVTDLIAGISGTTAMKLSADTYNDNGTEYAGDLVTNLIPIHPDNNPEWLGIVQKFVIEHNGEAPTVSQVNDEDVAQGTFIELTGQTPRLRTQGTYLQQTEYPSMTATASSSQSATARRIGLKMHWDESPDAFKVYSLDIEFKPAVSI
jgi:hypothetical protein